MSGGSYNYTYREIKEVYGGKMHDVELNQLINDLVPLLKSLEWWQSGDTSQDDYRKEVKKFKEKWFGKTNEKRTKDLITAVLEDAREKIETSLLYKIEKEEYF